MLVDLLLKNGATLDHKEETLEEARDEAVEKIITIQEGSPKSPTPDTFPAFYNLTDEYVKYLFDMSSNVTWEKCMPLAAWKKENPVLPNDIIDLICQIYKRATIFWR